MRGVIAARRCWRRWRAVLVFAALLAAFAGATLNGGARYLYCAAMDEVMTSCCCAPDRGGEHAVTIKKSCCCVSRTVDALPERTPPSDSDLGPTGATLLVAIVPVDWASAFVPARATRDARPPRATGPPRSARERRALSQTYLI